jgi:peptidoglycan/LPS O-acetylase OafA/YrhL
LKVNNFGLLRILAATQVVLGHSLAHLELARPRWWSLVDAFPGVPIFFAISGFLISASFERSPKVRNYARNRLLRIYPGLWCCILVTTVVAVAFGYAMLTVPGLIWFGSQLVAIIYPPSFLKSFGFGSYNGSLWTIPIELQFYFLLPLLYWATRGTKHRTTMIAATWAVFTVVAWLFAHNSPLLARA